MIVVHCSATRVTRDYPLWRLERDHRERGFTGCGYHYYIRKDGTCLTGRPEERMGAHAAGYNAGSIGVCYEGGLDADGQPADTRTAAQKAALLSLLRELRRRYPQAEILGHCELPGVQKACPCFLASEEYRDL